MVLTNRAPVARHGILFVRERYVNRILRKVLVMERQAEAGGVQLKAAVGSTTITNRVSSISVRSVIHEPGVNSS